MKDKDELTDIVQTVLSNEDTLGINLVYLFGSRAKALTGDSPSPNRDVGPLSDYDFGVVAKFKASEENKIPHSRLFKLQSKFARLLNSEVDLLQLNSAPIELQYNVIASGVLLFETNIELKVEYEARVLSRYGDYLPVLRRQREEIIQGGSDEARVQRYRKALGKTEQLFEQARTSKNPRP